MKKLEIGSGNRPLPGYDHLDIDPKCPELTFVSSMDVIPVPDNTYGEIISIHSIEHIGWRKARPTLQEWYRVLTPGGKVTIATPNLRWICQAYLNNNQTWYSDFQKFHDQEKPHIKVAGFHCHTLWANFKLYSSGEGGDEHMACFDAFYLSHLLKEVGFSKVNVLEDSDSLIVEAYK